MKLMCYIYITIRSEPNSYFLTLNLNCMFRKSIRIKYIVHNSYLCKMYDSWSKNKSDEKQALHK